MFAEGNCQLAVLRTFFPAALLFFHSLFFLMLETQPLLSIDWNQTVEIFVRPRGNLFSLLHPFYFSISTCVLRAERTEKRILSFNNQQQKKVGKIAEIRLRKSVPVIVVCVYYQVLLSNRNRTDTEHIQLENTFFVPFYE